MMCIINPKKKFGQGPLRWCVSWIELGYEKPIVQAKNIGIHVKNIYKIDVYGWTTLMGKAYKVVI